MTVRKCFKPIAFLLVFSLLSSACAMTGEKLRAQAREAYEVPEETTDMALQQDLDRCQKEAEDAGRGLQTAGSAVILGGVLLWPLIPVGS